MPRSPLSACWLHSRSAGPPSPRCRCRSPSWSLSRWQRRPARSCESDSASTRRACSREARSAASSTSRPIGPAEWIELELLLPEGVTSVQGVGRTAFRLGAGESRSFEYELACERWGAYRIGLVDVRIRSAFGLLSTTGQVDADVPLRAYPRRERLLRVVQAFDTTPFSGSQVSRAKGEGIEFADIRPFAAGDRVRRVNWRASARRERMYVNESHPERASDVILFLDSFAEARGSGEGTIDQAVRAASSLADAYLERRNRVGLVSFGGILRWLPPAMGIRQQYRIVEALIETELARSLFLDDRRGDSQTRPPAPGARHRLDPVARPADDQRPPRPPGTRLRPRGGRRLAGAVRRRRARQRRRPGLAALDHVASGAASPIRTSRRSRGRVVARPTAARRHRGGDGIPTSHALRLRLALIATSAVAACAVVLAPRLATGSMREDEQFLAIVALAALVFPLLGVARLLPWAVALLAGSVLVASEHGDIGSVGITLCAGLVLLVGECASAAGQLAPLTRIERRLARSARHPDRGRDRRCGRSRRGRPRLGLTGHSGRSRHADARAPGDRSPARARCRDRRATMTDWPSSPRSWRHVIPACASRGGLLLVAIVPAVLGRSGARGWVEARSPRRRSRREIA